MSVVSTVIVSIPTLDWDGPAHSALLATDVKEFSPVCSGGKLSEGVMRAKWGGTKEPQATLLAGAFNYLDDSALLGFVASLTWVEPENVQVFIKSEWNHRFESWTGIERIRAAGESIIGPWADQRR